LVIPQPEKYSGVSLEVLDKLLFIYDIVEAVVVKEAEYTG
jgi:hypothetical protein